MRHMVVTFVVMILALSAACWYTWNKTEQYREINNPPPGKERVSDHLPPNRLADEVKIVLRPGDDLRKFFDELIAAHNLPLEYQGDRESAAEVWYSGPLGEGLELVLDLNRIKPVRFSTGTLLMQMHRKYPPGYEKYRDTTYPLDIPEIALP